ncbi:MAG: preprotein translocase subunit SecA [Patescibacteria group bacterium]
MFGKLFDSNERQINKFRPMVAEINKLEEWAKALDQNQMIEQTNQWIAELKDKSDIEQKEHLNKILPKSYALVREASLRTLQKRHFDVQLMAGMVLHQGKISEQKTGEGKTLTATLPLYLNALTGKGAHLVTPNDYLSRHGAGWMGPIYSYLGLKVGVIMQERAFVYDTEHNNPEFQDEYAKHLKESPRKEAYLCHITYGTNHEFGFDYLRDNMARSTNDVVQTNPNGEYGAHSFAIVDEVDSILIDVARTPLIISTTAQKPSERYKNANQIVKNLIKNQDYEVDEKFKTSTLTDLGIRRIEKMLSVVNLYEQDFEMVHLLEQALTANSLYEKDKDYVVKDGQVIIVDQFTGRLLPSNRYSHGLHQALESKEGVEIQQESRTLAEISYQNYFRMYKKLAGMTGTAETEAEEFFKIYKLEVLSIPTHRPCVRKDLNDVIYKTEAAKFKAVADEIAEKHQKGQPVLVGTTSVEKSQMIHEQLKRRGVKHEILNAKNHENEALIIAQAGKKGAVTVSTNMAGRGVDIILGGDPSTPEEQQEITSLGGLHVIGTERHEARRIDNQLRGRAARQGDPGSSRFYISLQDDLMRIFGGDQMKNLMDRFGMEDNTPLEAGLVSRSIENAQKKVEGFHFDSRKRVVEFDDVINIHRDVVYKLRRKILSFTELADGSTRNLPEHINENSDWLINKLAENTDFTQEFWDKMQSGFGEIPWHLIFAESSLPVIDINWMDHLIDMENLRESTALKTYAQRDHLVEYRTEGHGRFELLVKRIYNEIWQRLQNIETQVSGSALKKQNDSLLAMGPVTYQHGELQSGVTAEDDAPRGFKVEEVKSGGPKIGRNDPCPCGSGKKFKNCHGK